MSLTRNQRTLLGLLDEGPHTTRQLVDASWVRSGSGHLTFDQVHSSMRRLEDRELVRRASAGPIHWEMTRAGRKALAG